MTPAQQYLFVLAHALLLCALTCRGGDVARLLSIACALASMLGLAHALGDTPRRKP